MIRATGSVERVTLTSSVRPDLSTTNESLADAVEWADAHPVAYRIVTERKSSIFGLGRHAYPGHYRDGTDAESVFLRLHSLRQQSLAPGIFGWRARFTLDHYEDKGFRGDLFSLWDGQYTRNTIFLDHTPATLEDVLDQFTEWCDPYYKKVEVRIEKRVVRRFSADGSVAPQVDTRAVSPPLGQAHEEEVDPFS